MNDGDELVVVHYYVHDCEWVTKYCDVEHLVTVDVPCRVLDAYR